MEALRTVTERTTENHFTTGGLLDLQRIQIQESRGHFGPSPFSKTVNLAAHFYQGWQLERKHSCEMFCSTTAHTEHTRLNKAGFAVCSRSFFWSDFLFSLCSYLSVLLLYLCSSLLGLSPTKDVARRSADLLKFNASNRKE